MLERYLQYEGCIHFLRDPPPARRHGHPASNKDSGGSEGIGPWPISKLPLMRIPGSGSVDSQVICEKQQVCRNLTTLKEAGHLTNENNAKGGRWCRDKRCITSYLKPSICQIHL